MLDKYKKSQSWYERGAKVIPGATQTGAKGVKHYSYGVSPIYVKSARGSRIEDVDGNVFLDCSSGVGPVILGYQYPAIDAAIKERLSEGITFTLPHTLEVELAELLVDIIPCAEMVKFGKNGNDVVAAAARLSRAVTGKNHILVCGYHGWQDWYIASTPNAMGIPKEIRVLTRSFNYNDLDSVKSLYKELDGDIAAIILEPMVETYPEDGFLEGLREITQKHDSLLVFDEIWTGFRFSLGGMQSISGVTPDLSTCSKAMGNGVPIAALVGKKQYMKYFDGEVFYYLTFGGEVLSLAAAIATINEIKKTDALSYIADVGTQIMDGYNKIAVELGLSKVTQSIGHPSRSFITIQDQEGCSSLEIKTLIQQEMIARGVLWKGFNAISYSYSAEDVNLMLTAYRESLEIVKEAIESKNIQPYLKGELIC